MDQKSKKGKLTVELNVKKTSGVFLLEFQTEGFVIVPCDRCLDEMELPILTSDKLKVKLGSSFTEEGDIVVVPEEDGYINIAWFLYEFIALNIPMKHIHIPGKSNKVSLGRLVKHFCALQVMMMTMILQLNYPKRKLAMKSHKK